MRKWITFLMTFLVVGSASCANASIGEVEFLAGYRHDSINLKHRVPSHDPVFKSNLKFKDIDIFQIGVSARSTIGCNFYARAEATWGWILDGDLKWNASAFNRVSPLFSSSSDNFSGLWNEKRHCNTFDEKYVYDANIAIGYPFYFCDCTTVVAPVIGYAVDVQDISVDDRGLVFDGHDCDIMGFNSGSDCCRHTFFSRWYGPFVGVDFNYRSYCNCWNFFAAVEYHWGTFKAKRSQSCSSSDGFDDFNRHADMSGWVVDLGADYDFNNCWTVGLYLKFTDFTASKNRHHHWGSDWSGSGSGDRARQSAHWNSYAVNVTVGREF